jgi:hypothetical protein
MGRRVTAGDASDVAFLTWNVGPRLVAAWDPVADLIVGKGKF